MKSNKSIPPYMDYDVTTKEQPKELLIGMIKDKNGDWELNTHKDYEIKEVCGKFKLIKKQPQYPKTYAECCEVLVGRKPKSNEISFDKMELCLVDLDDAQNIDFQTPQLFQLNSLFRLLMCLNAYWKIAGEEMGLDKPWKPSWKDDSDKYCICYLKDELWMSNIRDCNRLLVFPTEEMRDTFYENFKDLIEACKELL